MNEDLRARVELYKKLVPLLGKEMPYTFFREPQSALGLNQKIHPLVEGIYKPANSNYPICIASMITSPYADRLFYKEDGSWWMYYSKKSGPIEGAINQSVIRAMEEKVPCLIIKQTASQGGSKYRILGFGIIESYDSAQGLFKISELLDKDMGPFLGLSDEDELIESEIRILSLDQWTPFVQEERALYRVSSQKRARAFRNVVLDRYSQTCAVSGQRFVYNRYVEAEAAHIIAKESLGTDDPRNGIALSRTAHWAFERGIFTISDQYEIMIHPEALKASENKFHVTELNGKRISLPSDPIFNPHPDALAWHRKEKYGDFTRR